MSALEMPDSLLLDLEDAGFSRRWYTNEMEIPAEKGAYVLLLGLAKPLRPDRPPGNTETLEPGWYVYAGSARGPGGLKARIKRHFLKRKRKQWHIDCLTPSAVAIAAQVIEEGDECDLVAALAASFAFDIALPGFGSTDCPICDSHLLVWRPPEARPV